MLEKIDEVFSQGTRLIGAVGDRLERSPWERRHGWLWERPVVPSFVLRIYEGPSGLSFPSKEDESFLTCVFLFVCFLCFVFFGALYQN